MIRSMCFAVALLAFAPAARAQVQVTIGLPTIRFESPPPLVVVRPGVQVVEDHEEEVFYVHGWYWVRHHDAWYRTRDCRGGWVVAEPRYVPRRILALPPGHYRYYRGWGSPPRRVVERAAPAVYRAPMAHPPARRVFHERASNDGRVRRPPPARDPGHRHGHGRGHGR